MGAKALSRLHRLTEITTVDDLARLSLGEVNLTFAETRMCHWPDSMVSYLHEDQLLFSQDAFGMHLAGYERFADQVPTALLDREAARYYANILLPLSGFVARAIKKLSDLDLPLKIIAPDHGPIWRDSPATIVNQYARWAQQHRTGKAVVVYDTMWQSTAAMARAIGEGLSAGGASAKLMPLGSCHRSDVAAEMLDAGALLVGSPTINNQMFPSVADLMCYLKGLKPKGLVAAAFGSYGWSGEAAKLLQSELDAMGAETVSEAVSCLYKPDAETLARCRQLGITVAQRIR